MKYIVKKIGGEPHHILKSSCVYCGKRTEVEIKSFKDYANWQENGMLCQQAFPYLSATERETLISGLCPACQLIFFEGEDNE